MKRIAQALVVVCALLFVSPLSAAPQRDDSSPWYVRIVKQIVKRVVRPLDDPVWPGIPKP